MIGSIRLDGVWHFYADEEMKYMGFPPAHAAFTDTLRLPGTTAQGHKGKGPGEPEEGGLTERWPFRGNAWFRREVRIPENYRGKRMLLHLERTRNTVLWVNDTYIGRQISLCTPHIYDLSDFSGADTLSLYLCVDNALYPTKGGHMTSPDTQTNWNGVTGDISLQFFDENSILRIRALPDAGSRTVTLLMRCVGTVNMLKAEGGWFDQNGRVGDIPSQVLSVSKRPDGLCAVTVRLGSRAPLWDEYDPVIGTLTLRPFGSSDASDVSFGLTDFQARDGRFYSHGREVFLRGKHDGMLFPLEGAAPTDVESWLRVMCIAKEYGINHYRFHTCTPPDAAFTAADLLGIYMEPELPFWGTLQAPGEEGYSAEEQGYLIAEGRRILNTFSNHPSFTMFSLGNELWGNAERMGEILRYYKQKEKRILFTQGSNNFQFWPNTLPEDDFFCGVRLSGDRLIRGSYAACDQPYGHIQVQRPSTLHTYDEAIRPGQTAQTDERGAAEIEIQYGTGVKKVHVDHAVQGLVPQIPVVSHEVGQYCTYPDFREMEKYKGVLEARNFGIFRDRLEKAGMGERAVDFFECSGKLAADCYKAEIETAMRSKELSGFQLLDLQDFSGQGTALVGMLDAFMDSKGLITAEEWRGFCSDCVLLGVFPEYVTTGEIEMQILVRHHAPDEIHDKLHYSIQRGARLIEEGDLDVHIKGQGLFSVGTIRAALPKASRIHQVRVTLALPRSQNAYTLWQYPDAPMPDLTAVKGVCVTDDLEAALEGLSAGNRVLFLPRSAAGGIPGTYCTDFWCYPMFRSICESMGKEPPVGTLGLCIDKRHPALAEFQCERWTTPQWYDLVTHADCAVLDGLPIQPIVQMIDNFERNHKLGLLFECKVGTGQLLCCTARLDEISGRPEVAQFTKSLIEYMTSASFKPMQGLSPAQLRALFTAEGS
ncbi:MAG: beta-glucuronidase [Oscillospiraceae bacterium]|nr:beta-glucuronidase [Oscillospiraceae bacterium]